jgi:hypothetical protein
MPSRTSENPYSIYKEGIHYQPEENAFKNQPIKIKNISVRMVPASLLFAPNAGAG